MSRYQARFDGTWDGFRAVARGLLAHDVPDGLVDFSTTGDTTPTLFGGLTPPTDGTPPSLPRIFLDEARRASAFAAPDRWSLVYRLARRVAVDRGLLADVGDSDVLALRRRAKHVARDIHKMHAFVRFQQVQDAHGELWSAFHRPDHFIVEHASPHFERRFGDARFQIRTPRGSVLHLPGSGLTYGPPSHTPAEAGGDFEDLWNTYYANIYNPARTMVDAMLAEMPKKHWATMPETRQIPKLLRERAGRLVAGRSGVTLPDDRSLASLAAAVRGCAACPLADGGLHGVPGEGPVDAAIALVGEQPGDQEDRQGRAFVGPAGQLLDEALTRAGLDRNRLYLTNAVKHFRHTTRADGLRLHASPERYQVEICRTFVFGELQTLKPRVTVALGATAARSLLGKVVAVDASAGVVFQSRFGPLLVGPHPAAILRRPERSLEALVAVLEQARALAAQASG